MSIRFVIFHYSFNNLAGTERAVVNLLEMLTSYKNAEVILILASKKQRLAFNIEGLPVRIYYLGVNTEKLGKGTIHNIVTHLFIGLKLRSLLAKHKDVHTKNIAIATNPLLAYLLFLNRRWIGSRSHIISCEHFSINISGSVSRIIRKILYPKINVVTLTQHDRAIIEEIYKPLCCISIPNAIPFSQKTYNDASIKEKIILSIGRLSHQKGYDLLLEAFSMVNNKHPDWRLRIVGDDFGEKDKLIEIAERLKISNFEMLPANRNVEKFYTSASLFVLSSRYEGLPMVLLEALGFGLPIVSFNCPTGPSEVVGEDNGFLVENGNTAELADAINKLIEDSQLLRRKAEGSEHRALDFTKSTVNLKWINFMDTLV